MAEPAVRVALLARQGDARDQLRRALADLGAELVAEGDPAELDPDTVAGHQPGVVLVSLEPAVEDALARFDDLLAAPGVEVMYDDAEVTRQLDGWDLARWARHLAAKLVGGDVLPPAPGGADQLPELDITPEPGAPPTPAEVMADAKLEDYAAESLDLSEWVPSNPSLAEAPAAEAETVPEPEEPAADLELDLGDLEQAMGRLDAEVRPEPRGADQDVADLEFDASAMEIDLSALPGEDEPMAVAREPETALDEEPLLADLELADGPVNFGSFGDDDNTAGGDQLDDDVAALAAQLDAFEASEPREEVREPDFSLAFDQAPASSAPEPAASPAPAAPRTGGSTFADLSLVPMDGDAAPAASASAPAAAPPPLPAVKARGGSLSLADENARPSHTLSAGALLVLAGLGGPDAVRQLLSELPPTLPVPVLLYQHLDTGKHDRLVGQLAKASRLPLDLAVAGKLAYPGRVAVLTPGLGARMVDDNLEFAEGGSLAAVIATLPAAESGVLMLSGADPDLVAAVLQLMADGGLVLAQDPASCFDPNAAQAVQRAGADVASPAELAARVTQRWH